MKLLFHAALGVTIVAALAGCAPPPEPTPQVSCDGLTGTLTVSPGLSLTPQAQTYDLADTSTLDGCSDTQGLGIGGGTLESTRLVFPTADCTDPGDAAGSGLIRWDTGAVSAFTVTATPTDATSVRLFLRITAGELLGSRGAINVAVTPTAGDCIAGITEEQLFGAPFELVA